MSQNENIIAIKISTQLFDALGNYLFTRPYGEVVQLVQGLQESEPVYDEQPPITLPSENETGDK